MRRLLIALALVATSVLAHAKDVLPFIEDDYAKALTQAKAKKAPIFVEEWAPW